MIPGSESLPRSMVRQPTTAAKGNNNIPDLQWALLKVSLRANIERHSSFLLTKAAWLLEKYHMGAAQKGVDLVVHRKSSSGKWVIKQVVAWDNRSRSTYKPSYNQLDG